MQWGKPPVARSRLVRIFAWLPTHTKQGVWAWLEDVWRYEHEGAASGYYDYYTRDANLSGLVTEWANRPSNPGDGRE